MLTAPLVRAQKKVRNMVEKTKYSHEQTVDRYVDFTCVAGEDLDGKEEHIIRN